MFSGKRNSIQPQYTNTSKHHGHIKFERYNSVAGNIQRADAVVGGAMALTLLVSRALGIAPLRMQRTHRGWRVSCSRPFAVYSYTLKIILDVLVATGFYLDVSSPEGSKLMVPSTSECIVWCIGLTFVTSISSVGVFAGPRRMTAFIECVNLVNNIPSRVNGDPNHPSSDLRRLCFVILFLLTTFILFFGNMYTFILDAIHLKKELVFIFYIAVYVETFIVMLLTLQFILAGFLVETALKSINRRIEHFIRVIDLEEKKSYSSFYSKFSATAIPIPKSEYDVSVVGNTKRGKYTEYTWLSKTHKVSHFIEEENEMSSWACSYSVACEVMRKIDDSFSTVTALILGYTFFYLVMLPYYVTSYLISNVPKAINVTVYSGYMVWYTSILVLLTEPGNRIEAQMQRMQKLLSQVFRRVTPDDEEFKHLDCFYQQIILYQPSFSTCGISKMTRPLIIAVFAGITTYITIVVQLKLGNGDDDGGNSDIKNKPN